VDFKDYYKTLGVAKTASADEIKKAFRKLAREFHPDVAKDKARAEERFKEINEAYEVLSDPDKRRKYDTLGTNWNRQARGGSPWENARQYQRSNGHTNGESFEFHFGGTGFSDFFEQFFGGRGRPGGFSGFDFAQAETQPGTGIYERKGADVEGDLMVTLSEAASGAVRTISMRKTNPTTGAEETETFRVKIPSGVQEGQRIRVPGKGGPGSGGQPAGDLYLTVRFARHPDFEVHGSDLHYTAELAPWEAVLGATVSVPTLNGAVSVKIPAGTTTGQKLRLRGKGLPERGGAAGDLIVEVSVQVPAQVTAEEKKLWEELARQSSFSPRSARTA
jgi:curved DNA-binding protein